MIKLYPNEDAYIVKDILVLGMAKELYALREKEGLTEKYIKETRRFNDILRSAFGIDSICFHFIDEDGHLNIMTFNLPVGKVYKGNFDENKNPYLEVEIDWSEVFDSYRHFPANYYVCREKAIIQGFHYLYFNGNIYRTNQDVSNDKPICLDSDLSGERYPSSEERCEM